MFMCVVFYICTYISSSREERHLPTTWRINHKSNQINQIPTSFVFVEHRNGKQTLYTNCLVQDLLGYFRELMIEENPKDF